MNMLSVTNSKDPTSPPNWRELCEELVGWIERSTKHYTQVPELLIRVRTALAQPEPEVMWPTNVELMDLHDWMSDEWEVNHDFELQPSQYARAVLARWGNLKAGFTSSALPAEGEVAELVAPTDEELLELTGDWPATTGPRHDLSGCPEVPLYSVFADEVVEFARAVLARWSRPAPAPAWDHALRDAAQFALTTLEGWANHDEWLWPVSALEQAKRNTTEAVAALETALSRPAPAPVGEVK